MATNEKLNAVLEHGLRERLVDDPAEIERRNRLANLYSYSGKSSFITARSRAQHKDQIRAHTPGGGCKQQHATGEVCRCGVKKLADPDKVAYGDRILHKPGTLEGEPAWYMGYNNATNIAPGEHPEAMAKRYGVGGVLAMEIHENSNLEFSINAKKMPHHLNKKKSVDIYSSPLKGNPMEWAASGAYPQGSKIVHSPGRHRFSQVIDSTSSPSPNKSSDDVRKPESYEKIFEKEAKKLTQMNAELKLERHRRQEKNMERFSPTAHMTRTAVLTERAPSLAPPKIEKTRHLKSMTVFQHSNSQQQDDIELVQDRAERFRLKWKDLNTLNNSIRASLSKRQDGQEILSLLSDFQIADMSAPGNGGGGGHHHVSRDQFCSVIMKKFSNCPLRIVNRIYSAFDTNREDRIDYRHFIASLRILRHVGTPKQLLEALLGLYVIGSSAHQIDSTAESLNQRLIALEDVIAIFTLCCTSISDAEMMESRASQFFSQHVNQNHDLLAQDIWGTLIACGTVLLDAFVSQVAAVRGQ